MKVLLDTCTLIWLATKPKRLSRKARAAIDDASNELWLADVSVLELGLKYSAGKIELPQPPREWVEAQSTVWHLRSAPLDRAVMYRATELPIHHSDPFDRLLVATALENGLTILTSDEAIARYPVSVLWR